MASKVLFFLLLSISLSISKSKQEQGFCGIRCDSEFTEESGKILIKGGTVVNAHHKEVVDVYIEDGIVVAVRPNIMIGDDVTVIDATEKYVMPGGIDPHTHLEMDFMGTQTIDDFFTGQAAALAGGTTMHIDFVIPVNGNLTAGFDQYVEKSKKSAMDYGFHIAVTKWDETVSKDMEIMVKEKGINSFKFFMAYKGSLMINDDLLLQAFEKCKSLGALAMVHAENGDGVAEGQKKMIGLGITGPEGHALSRPPVLEGEATARAIRLASFVNTPLYVVHVMSIDAMEEIAKAKKSGQRVVGEPVVSGLILDDSWLWDPDFNTAAKYVMSPPIRKAGHGKALQAALSTGILQLVGTDHCAFNSTQKAFGVDDFRKIPNGVNGIEERMHLIWDAMVESGQISVTDYVRAGPNRTPLTLKTSFSGTSSPKNSPTFRRLGSSRTPRKDSRASSGRFLWVGNNRVVFWLILITLWAYIGFHVQSQWAHGDHNKAEFVGYKSERRSGKAGEDAVKGTNSTTAPGKERFLVEGKKVSDSNFGVNLIMKGRQASSRPNSPRKKGQRLRRGPVKPKETVEENQTGEMDEVMIPRKNTSYGLIVGPFGKTEDSVLEWSPEKRRGTCNRKGDFARLVWSRRFMLVFHELSMTGAPLSMLELATEILSCGGSVSAIILSKKGGLMGELSRRGIKVLEDRDKPSFKLAMKVDLVIAGSAVCSSWIEPYLEHFPAGAGQIVWWIMENRREYFDRSKHLLNRVKMLAFLSDSQSKQWLSWCEEEKIKFYLQPMLVPLSLNDELAFVAGIPCSLNTPASSVEKMMEKRDLLRSAVRKEMGLGDNGMLVMSLNSINPAKGQSFLLEAALLVVEHNVTIKDPKSYELLEEEKLPGVAHQNQTIMTGQLNPIMQVTNQTDKPADGLLKNNSTRKSSKKKRRKRRIKTVTEGEQRKLRKLLLEVAGQQEETLKVLIGSVGSKSNKVLYTKAILRFLSQHSNLSKTVLWTPVTTRVAALYAAADVYVINAQGFGETFGRVTIEAMAFGLPVLGTDAGGTREIVDHRVTGLLHPIGHNGTEVLAEHIQYLLNNPSVRKKMGTNGRQKIQEKYLKHQTYESFAKVLFKCMKPK